MELAILGSDGPDDNEGPTYRKLRDRLRLSEWFDAPGNSKVHELSLEEKHNVRPVLLASDWSTALSGCGPPAVEFSVTLEVMGQLVRYHCQLRGQEVVYGWQWDVLPFGVIEEDSEA